MIIIRSLYYKAHSTLQSYSYEYAKDLSDCCKPSSSLQSWWLIKPPRPDCCTGRQPPTLCEQQYNTWITRLQNSPHTLTKKEQAWAKPSHYRSCPNSICLIRRFWVFFSLDFVAVASNVVYKRILFTTLKWMIK